MRHGACQFLGGRTAAPALLPRSVQSAANWIPTSWGTAVRALGQAGIARHEQIQDIGAVDEYHVAALQDILLGAGPIALGFVISPLRAFIAGTRGMQAVMLWQDGGLDLRRRGEYAASSGT